MKKIVFTGGGTGGHIFPNIALMEQLKNKYEMYYIGSKNSMEEKIISENYPFYPINSVKFKRNLSPSNLLIPFKLIKCINKAKETLKKIKPDLIFSKGGYVSLPVVFAGKQLNIPCLTHESDLTMGLANKLMAKKCQYVLTSFDKASLQVKNGIYCGSPIRRQFLSVKKSDFYSNYPKQNSKPNLFVFAGSLGSKTINSYVFENIHKLTQLYNVFHIVGKGNKKQINIQDYHQFEFYSNIQELLIGADVVVSRGGSNSLFEILFLKKPCLIIPLPKKVSRGDQILNAQYFFNKKLANVLYEENYSSEQFLNSIITTLNNANNYLNNIKNIKICGNEEIFDIIEKTIIK